MHGVKPTSGPPQKRPRHGGDDIEKDIAAGHFTKVLGLSPNDRLEVLWDLGPDDSEPEEGEDQDEIAKRSHNVSVWWKASFLGTTSRSHELVGDGATDEESLSVPVYEICYDPRPANGFPKAVKCEFCILSERRLLDIQTDAVMYWRNEGSNWEPPPGDSDEEEEHGEQAECHMENVQQLVDSVLGRITNAHSERLQRMPAAQRLHIAERMGNMRERLMERLSHYKQDKPEATLDDNAVRSIVSDLGEEERFGGAANGC
eukprot:TRINITY_DN45228_c0_g1_i1.p1 TRINITY_DN45228_c0_g1~~TRINITY_DN45228_c0_g1_i1.p1  ORF type:complete len:259 (-),score=49.01 TRINITY_DN45228_c0_g1_i1:381-1157(-)